MDTSRFRATLLLTLVFATGAAVGVAADRLDLFAGAEEQEPVAETSAADTRERDDRSRGRQTAIEQFADELGLTAEQRSQIEGFLDHYRDEARALREAVQPQYRALLDSVRTQIESVLTEEQGEDYRELLRQRYGDGRERGGERGSQERDDPQRND